MYKCRTNVMTHNTNNTMQYCNIYLCLYIVNVYYYIDYRVPIYNRKTDYTTTVGQSVLCVDTKRNIQRQHKEKIK